MLNERGKLIGDFTMCRVSQDHVFLIGTYAAETYYMRWFERHLPPTGVSVRPCAMQYTGLSVAGRNSRALLQSLVRDDLATRGVSVHVVSAHGNRHGAGIRGPRVIHRRSGLRDMGDDRLPARTLRSIDERRPRPTGCGSSAVGRSTAMRIEKSFGSWAREFRPIYGPFEAGLGRFVNFTKGEFIGRAAAAEEKASGGALRLRLLQGGRRRMPMPSAMSRSGTTASPSAG